VKKLGGVASAALRDYFAHRCPQQAAGIAYRALFSMAPLAIVLVAVFGLILQDDSLRATVVDMVVDALPVSAARHQDVEDAITAIATPASALGLLALFVFLWAATGMMAAIRQGLECAMSVTESRPMLRAKLVDLTLVAGAALLVLISAAVTLLGVFLDKASDDVADATGIGIDALATVGLRGASFLLSTVVVLLLYRFVPARGLRARDGIVGAVVTALLLQVISLGSAWIYEKTTELSVIYGSLTAALVFLYSFYLYGSALLLGAEVAAAWSRPPAETGEAGPILAQLKRAGLGLFVKPKT
jgi:membrane protein